MATTSRATLRANLAASQGFYFAGSLTADGAAAGATLVDTKIARLDSTPFINKHIILTSTSGASPPVGEIQRISTISNDTVGTITPVRAFSAKVLSGVTYDILPYDPLVMHYALQEAGRLINSYSPLFLPDETLVVDNLLANWDFETYTNPSFASWTNSAGATATQSTTRPIHGSNAAQIGGVAGESISQELFSVFGGPRQIDAVVGKTLHVRAWILATVANQARLRVSFDSGSTFTNGPYHSGNGSQEGHDKQYIDVTIPADLTSMTIYVEKEVTGNMWCDSVVAWIDPISRYTVPTGFVHPSPTHVYQQCDPSAPNGNYEPLSWKNPPVAGRILRLEGQGRLTVPTTDSATVELDAACSELLVALAARVLHRTLKNVDTGQRELHAQEEADWKQEVSELIHASGIARQQEFPFVNRNNNWRVRDESGTSYLLLEGR